MNKVFILALITTLSSFTVWADHFKSHVDVKVGQLSPKAAAGQKIFNKECGACHGVNGEGTKMGPPLIHDIYNPGHHDNGSFSRAVKVGVKSHHWPFGNMPAQPQVGFSEMTSILVFIREVQQQNGIVKKAHMMR